MFICGNQDGCHNCGSIGRVEIMDVQVCVGGWFLVQYGFLCSIFYIYTMVNGAAWCRLFYYGKIFFSFSVKVKMSWGNGRVIFSSQTRGSRFSEKRVC